MSEDTYLDPTLWQCLQRCYVCDRPAYDCACELDPNGPLPQSACMRHSDVASLDQRSLKEIELMEIIRDGQHIRLTNGTECFTCTITAADENGAAELMDNNGARYYRDDYNGGWTSDALKRDGDKVAALKREILGEVTRRADP